MSEEQLIRDKLSEHGFLESTNKPGLFFHEVEEGTMIFCDLRLNVEGLINQITGDVGRDE